MPRLDAEDLRAWAARDWGAPERLARRHRARMPAAEKARLSIEMYEAALAMIGDRDMAAERWRDLECHRRLRAILDRAAHVCAR